MDEASLKLVCRSEKQAKETGFERRPLWRGYHTTAIREFAMVKICVFLRCRVSAFRKSSGAEFILLEDWHTENGWQDTGFRMV
jgi:hypothetical protein